MKRGGISWNGSYHHSSGITDRFVCSICGRQYKTQWPRDKHQRLCKQRGERR